MRHKYYCSPYQTIWGPYHATWVGSGLEGSEQFGTIKPKCRDWMVGMGHLWPVWLLGHLTVIKSGRGGRHIAWNQIIWIAHLWTGKDQRMWSLEFHNVVKLKCCIWSNSNIQTRFFCTLWDQSKPNTDDKSKNENYYQSPHSTMWAKMSLCLFWKIQKHTS